MHFLMDKPAHFYAKTPPVSISKPALLLQLSTSFPSPSSDSSSSSSLSPSFLFSGSPSPSSKISFSYPIVPLPFTSTPSSWHPMDPSSSCFRFESDFDESRHSPMISSSDNIHAREFETAFCRDFSCCGQRLTDLHDLLQHYEECHVRFEDDELDIDDEFEADTERLLNGLRHPLAPRDPFDEDGWSDSDSAPSSPFPISPSGNMGHKYRYRSGSAAGPGSESAGLSLAFGSDLDAAATYANSQSTSQHLHHLTIQQQMLQNTTSPFFSPRSSQLHNGAHQPIIHSTHPLFRRPSSRGSESEVDLSASSLAHPSHHQHSRQLLSSQNMYPYPAAVNSFDGFSASFHGQSKRKAMVTLADIYAGNQDDENDDDYVEDANDMANSTDFLTEPPTKRHAKDSSQQSLEGHLLSLKSQGVTVIGGMAQQFHATPSYPGSSTGIMGNLGAIGPPSSRHIFPGHYQNLSSAALTASPYVSAAVDLMRQRDEVYNIIEDLSKASGNNADRGDKPYRCSVQGCDKAYKNPNGLKYHNAHGHCSSSGLSENDSVETKPYVCTFLECGKRYKNLNGLKYHIEHSHPNLTAALKAHQSGLICNKIFGPFPQAARTIAAALQAVHASPMMMAAANAIMVSQQANAESAASSDSASGTDSATKAVNTETGRESEPKQVPPDSFATGQRPVVLAMGSIPGPLQRPPSMSAPLTNPSQGLSGSQNAYSSNISAAGPAQTLAAALPPHPGWTIERVPAASAMVSALGSSSAIPTINS